RIVQKHLRNVKQKADIHTTIIIQLHLADVKYHNLTHKENLAEPIEESDIHSLYSQIQRNAPIFHLSYQRHQYLYFPEIIQFAEIVREIYAITLTPQKVRRLDRERRRLVPQKQGSIPQALDLPKRPVVYVHLENPKLRRFSVPVAPPLPIPLNDKEGPFRLHQVEHFDVVRVQKRRLRLRQIQLRDHRHHPTVTILAIRTQGEHPPAPIDGVESAVEVDHVEEEDRLLGPDPRPGRPPRPPKRQLILSGRVRGLIDRHDREIPRRRQGRPRRQRELVYDIDVPKRQPNLVIGRQGVEETDVVSVVVGGRHYPAQGGENRVGRTVRPMRRVRDPVESVVREAVDFGGLGLGVEVGVGLAEHQPWEELVVGGVEILLGCR
ncbi:LOW QUALITY PROTEIN: hypothetical protein TorRG33x02_196630, partial [Trema orientale]